MPIKIFALDWVEQKMYWIRPTCFSWYNYFIYVGDVNFEEGKGNLDAIPSNLALDPYARLVMRHVRMILL